MPNSDFPARRTSRPIPRPVPRPLLQSIPPAVVPPPEATPSPPRPLLDDLLDQLGRSLGLPMLGTDELGVCMLVFDERTTVNLTLDPLCGELLSWCELGNVDAGLQDADARLRQLLRANLFWRGTRGATLAMMPGTDAVILARRWPMEGMTVDRLRVGIDAMVETADSLVPRLAGATSNRAVPVHADMKGRP